CGFRDHRAVAELPDVIRADRPELGADGRWPVRCVARHEAGLGALALAAPLEVAREVGEQVVDDLRRRRAPGPNRGDQLVLQGVRPLVPRPLRSHRAPPWSWTRAACTDGAPGGWGGFPISR